MRTHWYGQALVWLLIIWSVTLMSGCVAYQVINVSSQVVQGHSVTDYLASRATGADCQVVHVFQGTWWCEQPRVPDTTYNKIAF
jgi:hypothetical protein